MALSHNPVSSADKGTSRHRSSSDADKTAHHDTDISELLDMTPQLETEVNDFHLEQRNDSNLRELCEYLERSVLAENSHNDIQQLLAKAIQFTIVDRCRSPQRKQETSSCPCPPSRANTARES